MSFPRGETTWTPLSSSQEAIVSHYVRTATYYAQSWCGNFPYDRLECQSRAYMALMKAARTCPEGRPFTNWLGACIRQQIGGWQRKERQNFRRWHGRDASAPEPQIPGVSEYVDPSMPPPEAIVEADDMKERISRDLTPRERRVLDGLIDGLSYSEIGESIGVTAPAIHANVASIRRKTRRILDEQQVSP